MRLSVPPRCKDEGWRTPAIVVLKLVGRYVFGLGQLWTRDVCREARSVASLAYPTPCHESSGCDGSHTHTFTHRLYEDFSSQFLGKKGNLHSEVAKAALRARFVRATKTPRPFARCVARATVMAKLLRSWDDQKLMFIESPRPWDVSQTGQVPVP
jgi:hypothetical protein